VGHTGQLLVKADPFGQAMELRPNTASRVVVSRHRFEDRPWMERRRRAGAAQAPMSIYEVHLGSWRHRPDVEPGDDDPTSKWLSYRELAEVLPEYAADLGFSHLELLPIMEHPFDASWGYQVGGYFAPTSRYGTADDFRYFVDRCHHHGVGVILDWVPAHFPRDAFGLGRFDGTALYEHLDPRQGEHPEWGTYVFNYGRPEVKSFLISNALYWLHEFHVDGLRADAVAAMLYLDYARQPGGWIPNRYGGRENIEAIEFLRELNDAVHQRSPGALIIAEESTAWPGVTHGTARGGLGFDFKWNMGWMHDTLRYFSKDPVFRTYHHGNITFGLMYAFSEQFILPLSHDEVVHMKRSLLDKMSGDRWQRFANLRALYAHMWGHPGKKLLFMGGEIGQWAEWSEARQLDWHLLEQPEHAGVQRLIRDLNRLVREQPALHAADHEPEGFRWIDANDTQQSVVSYLRFPGRGGPGGGADSHQPSSGAPYVICLGNFTPVPRLGYRVGVPQLCRHREVLNTDAADYGGSGMGNLGGVEAQPVPCHGFDQSLELTLPPLAVLWLTPQAPS
jgi:1,4-alpha-glucan branching enzyme